MKTNLILTGWHYPEYMAAAAAMLNGYGGNADVYGVSMAALASMLMEKGPGYKNIDILGVGLTENLDELAHTLKDLARRKISVNWYSKEKMPSEAAAALAAAGASFAKVGVEEGKMLVEVVGDLVDAVRECDAGWLKAGAVVNELTVEAYAEKKQNDAKSGRCSLDSWEVWSLLYRAAGFAHRDHNDEDACALVVKELLRFHEDGRSIVDAMPKGLSKLMSDYQAGCTREFIGKSKQMKSLRQRLIMAANYEDASVLILGETGSGKDVAARYIHDHSSRRNGPYVHYNCANATNESMLKDELFGHITGGFTDAKRNVKGLVARANNGTLFLEQERTGSPVGCP